MMTEEILVPLRSQNEQTFQAVLACNNWLKKHDLLLAPEDARELISRHNQALEESGRIELDEKSLVHIIEAFYDSPYVEQNNLAKILAEITEIFYLTKNETDDRLSDRAVLKYLRQAFDGCCGGSLEFLREEAIDKLRIILQRQRAAEGIWDE